MKYYKGALAKSEINVRSEKTGCMDSTQVDSSKPGPAPKLSVVEQLFFFLVWLRQAFSQKHMCILFNYIKLSRSTASRYLITQSNYLYFCLGSLPIWPDRGAIDEAMPQCFRETYPSTRCIIDCTELFVQVPSSIKIQSAMYSIYKYHVTYKGLIGIAPFRAVTFVSLLYCGNTSDKEIVERCGFLNPKLWSAGDSVMADRGIHH